jgi:hypothetical protein
MKVERELLGKKNGNDWRGTIEESNGVEYDQSTKYTCVKML